MPATSRCRSARAAVWLWPGGRRRPRLLRPSWCRRWFRRAIGRVRGWWAVVVDRGEHQVLDLDAVFGRDALRGFRPHGVGNEERLPDDERDLGRAIVQNDGTHVDRVVDSAEALRAAAVACHGQ